jgi:hypothetical protein
VARRVLDACPGKEENSEPGRREGGRTGVRNLRRILLVFVVSALGVVLVAPSAGAKVLPFGLEVTGSNYSVGQTVTVVMHTDPQNVLPQSFRFEVRWGTVKTLRQVAKLNRKRGKGVLMQQVGPNEYRGTFKLKAKGLHAVYQRGTTPERVGYGYPAPILFVVKP